mmetsp:Transcript_84793/g.169383  ORF Transcript_84793/g.169383 Transcript_84793/m.169383 type:complete len:336 (+) Transcript_84793:72-1079(+)
MGRDDVMDEGDDLHTLGASRAQPPSMPRRRRTGVSINPAPPLPLAIPPPPPLPLSIAAPPLPLASSTHTTLMLPSVLYVAMAVCAALGGIAMALVRARSSKRRIERSLGLYSSRYRQETEQAIGALRGSAMCYTGGTLLCGWWSKGRHEGRHERVQTREHEMSMAAEDKAAAQPSDEHSTQGVQGASVMDGAGQGASVMDGAGLVGTRGRELLPAHDPMNARTSQPINEEEHNAMDRPPHGECPPHGPCGECRTAMWAMCRPSTAVRLSVTAAAALIMLNVSYWALLLPVSCTATHPSASPHLQHPNPPPHPSHAIPVPRPSPSMQVCAAGPMPL